jgi:hypothetical protein
MDKRAKNKRKKVMQIEAMRRARSRNGALS